MSFVYVGTDGFAAAVLRGLVGLGRTPSLVISRPDAPKGRGRQLASPPVIAAANELAIRSLQPEDIGAPEVDAAIDAVDPSCLALCAYGAIIREPLLSKRPILNLHPSLLPRWRGATPVERSLMEGDAETGVSIIRLVEELDAGPILAQESIGITESDDFGTLSERLITLGAEMLDNAIEGAEADALDFTPQAVEGVTYAERFEAADRFLDQADSVSVAERKVRALTPHVGARLSIPDSDPIGVREVSISEATVDAGAVDYSTGEMLVGFADGTLRIERLVPPGGREMSATDWLRGR